jgi:hypothetical protein
VLEKAGMPVEGVRALFVMNHEDGGFESPRKTPRAEIRPETSYRNWPVDRG